MPSLLIPLALKAATKESSWRLSTTMSGSDSSRWYSNEGKRRSSVLTSRRPLPSREQPNLYLDTEARIFGPQCFSLLPPRHPWSQREQGSEPSLPSQATPSPTHEALHRCNAPASSEKYNGPGIFSSVWREEASLGERSRGGRA